MSKKRALGRGLSALLSDAPEQEDAILGSEIAAPPASALHEIPIQEIEVNPFQPRQHFEPEPLHELAESIRVHGIIQPITVRRLSQHQYQLISGERRFKASKIAGLKTIPAYVRSANDQQMVEMSLIENIQRENLNPIEIALSYQRLISECSLKQEELGDRVGKNRVTVTNYLRLLKLPPDIQIALRDKKISMGQARAIISIENPDSQIYIFKKTMTDDLSVRKVEELVRQMTEPKEAEPSVASGTGTPAPELKEMRQLQSTLSSHFSTKISIRSNGQKGEIRIPFVSIEDLNRILDILKM